MLVVALLFMLVGAAIMALGMQRKVPGWLVLTSIIVGIACFAVGLALPIGGM